ncbi:MAG: 2,3-bisphosphoglycerate-independent phosphoglycerate mutase [Candidatus Omnitrophica bacterium]|nr:2,3-bisphosphoglycerate-independent phosphoglycerate mutase [Candidatus Omnitrophota bacterium]MBU1128217.1 2,3-bisphosphoglycerate-independent phosphoglycerate mutase [Candidatus Omnitrophota bacterium]MBU1784960.1 2,3-bisphosphoglycerate-independent phosphoglycerate mutase [Candidatus Omnitrophota bacterium]MBU1851811.1 2,3-bisphosphoglycerate-independent phosphoglycerate mutase [Candidatus Omnitrophota bacterium]
MSLELKKLKKFIPREGPVLLIIMDGVGLGPADGTNAVYVANTPCLDQLFKSEFFTKLKAHGTAVGLPTDEDMGNSEVGHNALGAGRVFAQGAKLVNNAIKDRSIFQTELWKNMVRRVKDNDGVFHFIGLLSDGNVHSHIDQLFAMVKQLAASGVRLVRVHALLDGRDVLERSALTYIKQTEEVLSAINSEKGYDYRIASGGGRMLTTMDRYNADWRVVKKGWDAHVRGDARRFTSAAEAVETYYEEDPSMTDQYMDSFVVEDAGQPVGRITDGDSVVFFNFRGDRAIEISRAFEEDDFDEFDRCARPAVLYAGMMEYDGDLHIPSNYLVKPPRINRTISEYLCSAGITMFAVSETQKFGHVTYFWNGNKSGYVCEKLEEYDEIPSDKIQFDRAPEMKAEEITIKVIELLNSGAFKFGRLNFANCDMVGHTAHPTAIVTAVETVDSCIRRLLAIIKKMDGIAIITADHGNADEMFQMKNGKRISKTAHTLNPVPFVIYDPGYTGEYKMAPLKSRGLTNVAATILNLLGYEKPEDYDPSLITFAAK